MKNILFRGFNFLLISFFAFFVTSQYSFAAEVEKKLLSATCEYKSSDGDGFYGYVYGFSGSLEEDLKSTTGLKQYLDEKKLYTNENIKLEMKHSGNKYIFSFSDDYDSDRINNIKITLGLSSSTNLSSITSNSISIGENELLVSDICPKYITTAFFQNNEYYTLAYFSQDFIDFSKTGKIFGINGNDYYTQDVSSYKYLNSFIYFDPNALDSEPSKWKVGIDLPQKYSSSSGYGLKNGIPLIFRKRYELVKTTPKYQNVKPNNNTIDNCCINDYTMSYAKLYSQQYSNDYKCKIDFDEDWKENCHYKNITFINPENGKTKTVNNVSVEFLKNSSSTSIKDFYSLGNLIASNAKFQDLYKEANFKTKFSDIDFSGKSSTMNLFIKTTDNNSNDPEPDNPEPDNPEPDDPEPDNPEPDDPEPSTPTYENDYTNNPCSNNNIKLTVKTVGKLISIIQIAVPIILVIMAFIDVIKCIVTMDDSRSRKNMSILFKRLLSAVIVFFIIAVIKLLCELIGKNSIDESCFNLISNPWN